MVKPTSQQQKELYVELNESVKTLENESNSDPEFVTDDRILYEINKIACKTKIKKDAKPPLVSISNNNNPSQSSSRRKPETSSLRSSPPPRSSSSSSSASGNKEKTVKPTVPDNVDMISASSFRTKKSKSSNSSRRSDNIWTEIPPAVSDAYLDLPETAPSIFNNNEQEPVKPVINELDAKIELLNEWEELCRKSGNQGNLRKMTINDDYTTIQREVKRERSYQKKIKAVKFAKTGIHVCAAGLEFLAGKLPEKFDVGLTGWSKSLKNDMSMFDDVLEELWDKYKGSGKDVPPELKLVGLFLVSAVQFIVVNKAPKMLYTFFQQGYRRPTAATAGGDIPIGGAYNKMTPPNLDDDEINEILHDNHMHRSGGS